jgi:ribosomal 50S subunit-associated protein YjgA (DUF615 family)
VQSRTRRRGDGDTLSTTGATIVLLSNNTLQKLGEIASAISGINHGKPFRQPKRSLAHYLDRQVDSLPIADGTRAAVTTAAMRTRGTGCTKRRVRYLISFFQSFRFALQTSAQPVHTYRA